MTEMDEATFAERFPNVSREHHEYVAKIVRPAREFAPAENVLFTMFDWCVEQGCPWAASADITGREMELAVSFPDHRVAVEFQLRFG